VQVSVSLTLQVPSTATIEVIEEACVKASRKAARDAMSEPCRQMEHARARRSSKTRGRRPTILTRCGYLTITRGPSRSPDGSEYFPLDERLGHAPHHEDSPYVRRRGCELVACHPYREAARLLSAELGTGVDHRAIWRRVQADGDAKLRARAQRVNAMFADGEARPPPTRKVPAALHLAVDATGIRLIEGEGASVKLAVAFTGTEQLTGAKHRLVDRHVFADICEPDPSARLSPTRWSGPMEPTGSGGCCCSPTGRPGSSTWPMTGRRPPGTSATTGTSP